MRGSGYQHAASEWELHSPGISRKHYSAHSTEQSCYKCALNSPHCQIFRGTPFTNTNNYAALSTSRNNQQNGVGKFDHNLNDRWKIFGTYAKLSGSADHGNPWPAPSTLPALKLTTMSRRLFPLRRF